MVVRGDDARLAAIGLPRLPRELLRRPRLDLRLDERAPVTVLRAPAGYGKTVLVASWLGQGGAGDDRVVWLAPDRGRRAAELLAELDEALGASGPDHRRAVRAAGPLTLVVDGLDRVDPVVDRELLELVRDVRSLRLVVCTRSLRTVETAGRVEADAVVLTAADLAFTGEEVGRLLAWQGVEPEPELVETLREEIGGWPAAVRAAVLSIGDRPPAERGLTGTDWGRAVEFLTDALAAVRDPDLLDLMRRTSVAEDLTPAVAAVLTEAPDLAARLAWLEGQGMLDTSLEAQGRVYRYPALVRRRLAAQLEADDPALFRELHARMIPVSLAADLPDRALAHAMAAGDDAAALQILETYSIRLLCDHMMLMRQAMATLPAELLDSNPTVRPARHFLLGMGVTYVGGDPDPDAPDGALVDPGPDVTDEERIGTALGQVIPLRTLGRFDEAERIAAATAHLVPDPGAGGREVDATPLVRHQWGILRLLRGDLRAAVADFTVAFGTAAGRRIDLLSRNSAASIGLVHALRGDLRAAETWLDRAKAVPEPRTPFWALARTTETCARALVALSRLDVEAARTHLGRLGAPHPRSELWSVTALARGSFGLLTGEPFAALAALEDVRAEHRATAGPGTLAAVLLDALTVDLLLSMGQGTRATALLARAPDGPVLDVRRARAALLTGDPETALHRATEVMWLRSAFPRHRLEMQVIEAVALHRTGRGEQAVAALERAGGTARLSGLLAPLAGVPRAELTTIAAGSRDAAVHALVADPAWAVVPELVPASLELIELSERERAVLDQLAQTHSLELIASRLFVSTNTVKTQVKSVYRKLGVHSRAEALATAYRFGLLES